MDQAKLEAAGFAVERCDGGAMIKAPRSTQPQFVAMHGDSLVLVTQRSSFHRQINSALGGENPNVPGDSE